MRELQPEELRRRCDPGIFQFETTAEVKPLEEVIGQERAVQALECGLGIKDNRYNIYVAGGPGTGKMSIVRSFLEKISAKEERPPDICYVHNFEDPYTPRYLLLPSGKGARLQADMSKLIELLKRDIPTAFKSEEYQERKRVIGEEINRKREELFVELEGKAKGEGFALQRTPIGINAIPLIEGRPMSEEEYKKLSEEERRAIEERHGEVRVKIEETIREAQTLEEEQARRLEELNREVAAFSVEPKVAALKETYGEEPRVVEFLDEVKRDILSNLELFLGEGDEGQAESQLERYDVNVLVDNSKTEARKVALKSGKITIEDPATVMGYAAAEGLRPEPIPLQTKLIIVGSRELWGLLQAYEEDFQEFFKIKSEFASE
ncbi:MAG: AAA family ATPase, partial [Candidatus Bipolaricaulia bacterium]